MNFLRDNVRLPTERGGELETFPQNKGFIKVLFSPHRKVTRTDYRILVWRRRLVQFSQQTSVVRSGRSLLGKSETERSVPITAGPGKRTRLHAGRAPSRQTMQRFIHRFPGAHRRERALGTCHAQVPAEFPRYRTHSAGRTLKPICSSCVRMRATFAGASGRKGRRTVALVRFINHRAIFMRWCASAIPDKVTKPFRK